MKKSETSDWLLSRGHMSSSKAWLLASPDAQNESASHGQNHAVASARQKHISDLIWTACQMFYHVTKHSRQKNDSSCNSLTVPWELDQKGPVGLISTTWHFFSHHSVRLVGTSVSRSFSSLAASFSLVLPQKKHHQKNCEKEFSQTQTHFRYWQFVSFWIFFVENTLTSSPSESDLASASGLSSLKANGYQTNDRNGMLSWFLISHCDWLSTGLTWSPHIATIARKHDIRHDVKEGHAFLASENPRLHEFHVFFLKISQDSRFPVSTPNQKQ